MAYYDHLKSGKNNLPKEEVYQKPQQQYSQSNNRTPSQNTI
jgi:hypothetical protein